MEFKKHFLSENKLNTNSVGKKFLFDMANGGVAVSNYDYDPVSYIFSIKGRASSFELSEI